MSKSLLQINKDRRKEYNTSNNTFKDFPVGTSVKVICTCRDFYFFYGETGVITKSTDEYLGIEVTFDKPRHFKGGHIQRTFNFKPSDLIKIRRRKMKKVNPIKNFFINYLNRKFKKEKPKTYELVPFRTRVRMYVRGIELKSKGNIPYNTLRRRVRETFNVDLKDMGIDNKAARRLIKSKKVFISKKDLDYENNR